MSDSLADLTDSIVRFRDDREWKQFHSPRNLAAALAVEAAELQAILLWKTDSEIRESISDARIAERFRHEIADVLIFALLMADSLRIDPASAILEKLELNGQRYPADLARGRSTKYTELSREDRQ